MEAPTPDEPVEDPVDLSDLDYSYSAAVRWVLGVTGSRPPSPDAPAIVQATATQPVGNTNQPAGIASQPVGNINQPAGITSQPIGNTNQPLGITNQPIGTGIEEIPL